jgi:hypothetical protein
VEIVCERVAAIDVGKKIVAVAVRTPGERPGKRRQQLRKYNTFHQTLPPTCVGRLRRRDDRRRELEEHARLELLDDGDDGVGCLLSEWTDHPRLEDLD